MKNRLFFSLILFFLNGLPDAFAEKIFTVDTSETHLDKLTNVYEYYFFQNKTLLLTEAKKTKYENKMRELERKMVEIENERSRQKTDSAAIMKNIIALLPESKPIYAHEQRSWLINLGTSFLGFSYLPPIYTSADYNCLGNKVSIGAYAGFFTERKKASSGNYVEKTSYTYTDQIYKYNYVNFGVRGTYHLLNLEPLNLSLNAKIFDLYVTVLGGYNISFLKSYLSNTTLAYEPAKKKGPGFGTMLGIRFFPDDNFNLFAEAGYSSTAYLSVGFGYRFLPSSNKKDE